MTRDEAARKACEAYYTHLGLNHRQVWENQQEDHRGAWRAVADALARTDLEADRELLRAYGKARASYDGPGCRQHDLPESDAIAARADELAEDPS